ncbi:cobalamin biosynthesis protein [Arenibacterium sp. CAU 1754]
MSVAGFGFRADVTMESLRSALEQAQGDEPITALAAPRDKATTPVFIEFAAALKLPVVAVDAGQMQAAETATQSTKVFEKRGTGSVAEAVALVGAGYHSQLKAPRAVSSDHMATCAIAKQQEEE